MQCVSGKKHSPGSGNIDLPIAASDSCNTIFDVAKGECSRPPAPLAAFRVMLAQGTAWHVGRIPTPTHTHTPQRTFANDV